MSKHYCMACTTKLDGHHTTCPECGATPPDSTVGYWLAIAFGAFISLTIIGALLGIPLALWAAQRIRMARHGRITEPHDATNAPTIDFINYD